jgi:hypothetical protein
MHVFPIAKEAGSAQKCVVGGQEQAVAARECWVLLGNTWWGVKTREREVGLKNACWRVENGLWGLEKAWS